MLYLALGFMVFHDSFQFLWFGVGKNAAHHELKHNVPVSMHVQNKRKIK